MISQFQSANHSVADSLHRLPVAWLIARKSIKYRYRRSALGPFWITLTQAVYVLALVFVFGKLFPQGGPGFVPYVASGVILWSFISTSIQASSQVFVQRKAAILDGDLHYLTHVFEVIFENALIFAHNAVILIIVVLLYQVPVSVLDIPAMLLGLLLIAVNLVGIGAILGILTARYRDLEPLVVSGLQILFFATPIMWKPEFIGESSGLVKFNPVHHWLSTIREQLTGGDFQFASVLVTLGTGILSCLTAYLLFVKFHRKIASWL
ncbi:MAG: ABC transporter permease [Verrucomicrobiales bacterium]|nr:ABC transporter permease [Verrucomicrobiales bacterium]